MSALREASRSRDVVVVDGQPPVLEADLLRQVDRPLNPLVELELVADEAHAALEGKRRQRRGPAVADLSYDVGARNPHLVVEDHVHVLVQEHGGDRPDLDSRRAHVADEPRQAVVSSRRRVGPHEELLEVGVLRVGRPHLDARHDDVVAVDDATGREGREIGAGVRLGEALTPERFPGQDPRQMVGLLLVRPAGDQRRPRMHQRDVRRVDVVRRVRPRQLLVPDHLLEGAQAAAAVLLRPGDARPAVLVELPLPCAIEVGRGAASRRPRRLRDIGLQPGACARPELVVFFGVARSIRPQTSSSAWSSLASSVRFEPNRRARSRLCLRSRCAWCSSVTPMPP